MKLLLLTGFPLAPPSAVLPAPGSLSKVEPVSVCVSSPVSDNRFGCKAIVMTEGAIGWDASGAARPLLAAGVAAVSAAAAFAVIFADWLCGSCGVASRIIRKLINFINYVLNLAIHGIHDGT